MKLRGLLLAAALVFCAALPAAASATTTHWFYEREVIAEGVTREVPTTSSKLEVVLKQPKLPAVKIPCEASGVNAFWNTPEGGRDETRSIAFTCTGATVTPFLPWTSTLLESEVPLYDEWAVSFDLEYEGVDRGVFTGTLQAKVGDVDPEGEKEEGGKDELDNNLFFKGSTKLPHLTAPNGNEVWLSGYDRQGGKGTGIGDE